MFLITREISYPKIKGKRSPVFNGGDLCYNSFTKLNYFFYMGKIMKKTVLIFSFFLLAGFSIQAENINFKLDTGLSLSFADINEEKDGSILNWETAPEPEIFYNAVFSTGNFLIGTSLNGGFWGNFGTFSTKDFSRPAKTNGNLDITVSIGGTIPFTKVSVIPYGGFLFKKIYFSSLSNDLEQYPEFNKKNILTNLWIYSPRAGIQCIFELGKFTLDFNTGFYPYIFSSDLKNGWGIYEKIRLSFLIPGISFPLEVFTGIDYEYISHKIIQSSTFKIPLGIKTMTGF